MVSAVPDGSLPKLAEEPSRSLVAGSPVASDMQTGNAWLKSEFKSPDFPRRVLLVEPSFQECARLRNDLLAGQLEVFTASDLTTAVHALSNFQPNLILAHMRLPLHGGIELVRRVKECCSTQLIPVILYSDITTAEERVRALDLG